MAENNDTWKDEIAGDGADAAARMEALQDFDSPAALFDAHQGFANANWRDAFVPEDDPDGAVAKQMERFNAPADYGTSFREAQATLSSSKQAVPLGADATDEDKTHFRTTNELPLEVGDYFKNMPDGIILGEKDLAVAEVFMEVLHGDYIPAATGHKLIAASNKMEEEAQAAEAEMDTAHNKETTVELRAEWGGDYRAKINHLEAWMGKIFGTESKDQLLHGRYQDGRGFMNDPNVLKALSDLAWKDDPMAPIISTGTTPVTALNDEIAEILNVMRTDRPRYNKDQKMQNRLLELNDIKLRHDEKAA